MNDLPPSDDPAGVAPERRVAGLATTTLLLLTPALLHQGLRQIGLRWDPAPWDGAMDGSDGLYVWVDGAQREVAPEHRAILYIGIGTGDGGANERVHREDSWREEYLHAHALAVRRRSASALLGEIDFEDAADERWTESLDLSPEAAPAIARWRRRAAKTPARAAEVFAVRLSIHLGDVSVPVNSQYAGAWASSGHVDDADWAAYAVALRMVEESASSPCPQSTPLPNA